VSTTPAINLYHRFSFIGSVVDTGDKFITGDAEQWSPVTMTPMINFSPVSTTPVNNCYRWITGGNVTDDKFFAGINDTYCAAHIGMGGMRIEKEPRQWDKYVYRTS
jgi:hypothetical protein